MSGVRIVGGILPGELPERVIGQDLTGIKPADYDLPPGESVRAAASRAWAYLLPAYLRFREGTAELPTDAGGTALTRDAWLGPLFKELGYGRLKTTPEGHLDAGDGDEVRSYPISHLWHDVPVHMLGWNIDLDSRQKGVRGAARAPQSMVQEYLNREPDHLWAILTNGKTLRLLRDSTALVGQAYVEFNLQEIFDSEAFPDFVLLFAMCHESRLRRLPLDEGGDGESAVTNRWIERWRTDALASGTRALASLRGQVEKAIEVLGTGYLAHPANQQLRDRLQAGEITAADYQRAVLRLVYRLLFWMVAEDRDVLFAPGSPAAARARYDTYFSSRRLRSLARNRVGTRHYDLSAQVDLVFNGLGSEAGMPELGLPALGGLFENTEVDVIAGLALPNHALLEAIRLLSTTMDANKQTRRSVDFRHLGAEELGSIYEGLLELHPRIDPVQRTFTLVSGAGNERKSTGSYYTPSSLIDLVLDNSLDPLLDRATATGTNEERQAALLALRVCDPACGSGHFLVAAARRIANRLARLRSDETEPSAAQVQAAVHEIVNNCIYGVDLMPMAAELAKVSLWLEAIQPGRPLGFLDAHIKVGNSLIGTTPALLAAGIPDGAFGAVTGDDKKLAAMWRKRNAVERDQADQISLLEGDTEAFSNTVLVDATKALNALPSLGLADVAIQRQRYRELRESDELLTIKRAADAWTAAFFQVKNASNPVPITTDTVRAIEQRQPVASEVLDAVETLTAAHRSFHWHIEFPDVFATSNATSGQDGPLTAANPGFDAVIGNPPYLDSEDHIKENGLERRFIEANYAAARGNWDLFVPFVELANQITACDGLHAMVTPNKILGVPYVAELQALLLRSSPVVVLDASGQDYFSAASVPVAIVSVEKREPSKSSRTRMVELGIGAGSTIETLTMLARPRGFAFAVAVRPSPLDRFTLSLESLASFSDGASTSQAYEIREIIYSNSHPAGGSFKLINTGSIDPFRSKWGLQATKYLGFVDFFPTVQRDELERIAPRRAEQAASAKVVLAGMSAKLEAFADPVGEYLCGKSAVLALPRRDVSAHGLAAYLNSPCVTSYYRQYFGSQGFGKSSMNVGPKQVAKIPSPPEHHLEFDARYRLPVEAESILTDAGIGKPVLAAIGLALQTDPTGSAHLEAILDDVIAVISASTPTGGSE